MALEKDDILKAAAATVDPATGARLGASVQHAAWSSGHASLRVAAPAGADTARLEALGASVSARVAEAAREKGEAAEAIAVVFVDPGGAVVHTSRTATAAPGHKPIRGLSDRPQNPQSQTSAIPGVRFAIAVGAGKGGVGKSTVAVNLGVELARRGHAVGILDGDIYGPSLPTLLGLDAMEQVVMRGRLQPFMVHGVKSVTIGKLVDPEKPLIWRGPMAHGAFKQLAEQTEWGDLDYLIIDLPPGTGDVSLTMAQVLRLTGAVVVCTPQKVAQDDAVRAAKMFEQLGIEVLGVVENMSYFVGDDGKEYDIFGRGGAENMASRLGVPFLGAIPLTMSLRKNSDRGDPSANFTERGSMLVQSLEAMVTAVEGQAGLAAVRQGQTRPTLTIT